MTLVTSSWLFSPPMRTSWAVPIVGVDMYSWGEGFSGQSNLKVHNVYIFQKIQIFFCMTCYSQCASMLVCAHAVVFLCCTTVYRCPWKVILLSSMTHCPSLYSLRLITSLLLLWETGRTQCHVTHSPDNTLPVCYDKDVIGLEWCNTLSQCWRHHYTVTVTWVCTEDTHTPCCVTCG